MQKYKILHIYNQCVHTTIPLQSFLQIKNENFLKFILSWNQKDNDKELNFFRKKSNSKFYSLGFKHRNLLIVLIQYYKYLKIIEPDLIHLHHSYSSFFGSLIGKFFKIKIILTIHSDYSKYSLHNKILFWGSMLLSNKIIANSKNTFYSIPKVFRKKTIIIYNGVELNKIRKIKYNFENKKDFIICSVARLVKLKDIDIVIKAFNLLQKKYDNVKLYIIGDGPERENLERISNEYLNNSIFFTGKIKREEVYKIIKNADIFCSASKWEGFGNAVVEAMATNIAIVSSMIPVSKEVVGEDNALYFEVGNYQELFLQIEQLYLNKDLREELANRAFEKSKEFSIQKNIEENIKLYENLLNNKKISGN